MHPPVSRLPEPDPEALAHSRELTDLIRREIKAEGGRLPFQRFMELALYAPGLGYYVAGASKLGEAGDFITAPEASPLFGRCLAHQCAQVLSELGGGTILEFGAGTGRLAVDLLGELGRLGWPGVEYHILEVSPDLRMRQQATLTGADLEGRVRWLDRMPQGMRGVVIANEVLDAMPVQRFRLGADEIAECFVVETPLAEEGQALRLIWEPAADGALRTVVAGLIEDPGLDTGYESAGYESEYCPSAAPWIGGLADTLEAGLALLIDYGQDRRSYYHAARIRGTLMCHYRHRAHEDPLFLPGLQDITADVDFSLLATAARAQGLEVAGFTTQALFLLGCGLDALLEQGHRNGVESYLDLAQGAKRLILPTGMGERFKVLALTRALQQPLIGFRLKDQRERL